MLEHKQQDRYIKAGQINTRYWALGDQGTSVILIHGIGASAEIWMHNIEALAEQHRVYVPDVVGFGHSDKPAVPYSPSCMANFINDFMAALNIESASLVGLSLGGGIALQYALQFPDKVEKLVLVDSAGLGKEATITLRLATLPLIGELLTRPNRKGLARYFKQLVYDPALITDDLIELYYNFSSLPGAQKAFLAVLRAICTIRGGRADVLDPVMKNLGTITAPTLIVWGKQDRILPVKHGYFARENLPDARLHIFDPCGHMPNFERPEDFNTLVMEFLSG